MIASEQQLFECLKAKEENKNTKSANWHLRFWGETVSQAFVREISFCMYPFFPQSLWTGSAPEEDKMWKRSKVTDQTAAGQAGKCRTGVRSVRSLYLHYSYLSTALYFHTDLRDDDDDDDDELDLFDLHN